MMRRRKAIGGPLRRQRRADEDRLRASDAALAAERSGRSLTARLMGDPLPGRSAFDLMLSGSNIAREPARCSIDLRPCPILAVDVIEALSDPDEQPF